MGFFDKIAQSISDAQTERELSKYRKEEIDRYLENARKEVRSAKEYYDETYEATNDLLRDTRDNISEHNEFKKEISKKISREVSPVLINFQNFHIDSRITIPKLAEIDSCKIDISSGIKSFSNNCIMPTYPSVLNIFSSSGYTEKDVNKACKQYEKALDFSVEMAQKGIMLGGMANRFNAINTFIKEEKNQLSGLMNKLDTITEKLKNGMKNTEFTEKEASYMKGIHGIGNCIVEEISTDFLDRDFNITEQYKKSFENIKKINSLLPESPQIDDNSLLDGLKKILDGGIIVY